MEPSDLTVAMRMGHQPIPGVLDDASEVLAHRFPSEDLPRTRGARHENRRVSWPPLPMPCDDISTRNAACDLDDLCDGIATPAAKVKRSGRLTVKCAKRERVGTREVRHVNVVPHASSVRSRVVVPEDRHSRKQPPGRGKDERDEVRPGIVLLSVSQRGTRGVEIAQANVSEPVRPPIAGECPLESELRLSIWIGRGCRRVFGDWRLRGLAIDSRRGREHETSHARPYDCVEKRQPLDYVVRVVLPWVFDRLTDQRGRRQVDHCIEALIAHEPCNQIDIGDIATLQASRRRHGRFVSLREIVEDHHLRGTLGEELFDDHGAYESGPTGNENARRDHGGGLSRRFVAVTSLAPVTVILALRVSRYSRYFRSISNFAESRMPTTMFE